MILIVGGAGYIGSHVNKILSKQGFETVVFDNMSYGHKHALKWGQFFKGDMSNPSDLKAVFNQYPIKAVMHFAAFINVGESVTNPEKYYINNVVNTMNLLRAMIDADVNKFVFSSTCAVYGEPQYMPLDEKHPFAPVNPYGNTKLAVERILSDYEEAYGLRSVTLRYFNAAGADPETETGEWHVPETHLIPLVLDAAIGRRNNVKIFGTDYDSKDGTCVRDYIHVNDLASAHIQALKYLIDGGASDAFNLGNGQGFTVKEIIDTACSVTGKEIKAIETERRPGDAPVLIGSSAKAKSVLGWEPQFKDISTIVETAWKWHQVLESLRQ